MDLQATAQLLGNFGEFVGSIAIVITLVYLAVQIRQSSRSTTMAATQAIRAERMAWFIANRDSPCLTDIFERHGSGEAVSLADEFRLGMHNGALWSTIYSQWMDQELGLSGRFATKDQAMLHQALITPGAMQWWEAGGNTIYPDEFCRYVENRLSDIQGSGPSSWRIFDTGKR